jgi:hypothetical protein
MLAAKALPQLNFSWNTQSFIQRLFKLILYIFLNSSSEISCLPRKLSSEKARYRVQTDSTNFDCNYMNLDLLLTFSRQEIAKSRSSIVCSEVIDTLSRALPLLTVGYLIA